MNVDARVHGAIGAPRGNVLIVANHVSWLDIFVLQAEQPARFVAKSELARWPVIGRLIRGSGTLFIERTRRRDTERVNRRAADALRSGDAIVVFPEGTTTDGTTVLKFHGSLLQPVVDAEGHLLPVAIRYHDGAGTLSLAAEYAGDTSFATSFWRVCGERRLAVDLIAASPMPGERRAPARARARGRDRYPNGFGCTGCRDGTWSTRRSSSLIAVSVPPHRQPESSISTFGSRSRSSVDQWPHTTVSRAVRRPSCSNQARKPAGACVAPALLAELDAAVGRAEAQPRAHVDDHAQAIVAVEVVAPRRRLVAVEHAQEPVRVGARELGLDLAGQHLRVRGGPRRQQAGVHHQALALAHDERARREPVDEVGAIGRGEDVVERVAAMRRAVARGDGQQVQVVVAEHDLRRVAQRLHLAQDRERTGAAVDEVADEPQPVARRREPDQVEQLHELLVAALQVADRVVRHRAEGSFARASRLHDTRRRC